MTTTEGIQYVQAVLREDGNSDRVTLTQLVQAANLGCIDMFKNSRCAAKLFTLSTVPGQAVYAVDASIFQIADVRFFGRQLREGCAGSVSYWQGSQPQSWTRQDAFSITLHPAPQVIASLTIYGYVLPSVVDTVYPLLTVVDTLPDPAPDSYTPVTGGFTAPMLTTTLPTPPPEQYVEKYQYIGDGEIVVTDSIPDPVPSTLVTLYSYAGETSTKYVVGTFNLTPDCDNGPWDYAVMRLAATILADDAGAQTRAKSCAALYEQAWRALSSRMY